LTLLIGNGPAQDQPPGGSEKVVVPDNGPSTSNTSPQEVVGQYVAALEARIDDAAALAEASGATAWIKSIEEFREIIDAESVNVHTVVLADKEGPALVFSDPVKLTRAGPGGQDTGRLLFRVVRAGGSCLITDIDFESERSAGEATSAFRIWRVAS
jgi:hypothetical protein